ncbi:hypothetical protein ACGFIV_00880 [Sphaerisporangium sp. NPDC049003]|uniref:hypothetical protein n=1 Tax=Sphaerisporangium sp. NPDC049003 TaxID=3364517 RepID=UPI00371C4979
MSGRYTFTHDQGATLDRILTYKTDAGVPIPISGMTARMQIRSRPDASGTLYATLSTTDGSIVVGGAGTIRLMVDADVTSGWSFRTGYYDLELTDPSAEPPKVRRLIGGSFVLSPEVTIG